MARDLGYTEATLMQRVDDIAAGKPFAGQALPPSAKPKPRTTTRPRPR
jgi:hypothetical protein